MGMLKVCGIRDAGDALAAAEAGFDAVGLVFAESPRRVSPRRAREISACLPHSVLRVGVFDAQSREVMGGLMEYCGLDLAQIHGAHDDGIPPGLRNRVIVALRPRTLADLEAIRGCRGTFAMLIDAWHPLLAGGTGMTCDWGLAAIAARKARVIVAGGLHAGNVAEAIARVRPFGVDVSSGVEREPGIKDRALLRSFARAAREAFAQLNAGETGEERG